MIRVLHIWLFIILAISIKINSAYGGTDLLSNALTQSNSFLKEAGLVQQKYSGIARKLVTTKVSIDPDKLKLGKLEKIKEKLENAKEKAANIQERIETAKERKEELMAKYQELNAKAQKYRAQAQDMISQGKEIKEQYMTYYEQASDIKSDVADSISNAKNAVGLSSGQSEEPDTADLQTTSSLQASNSTPEEVEVSEGLKSEQAVKAVPMDATVQTRPKATEVTIYSNRASAIQTAQTIPTNTTVQTRPEVTEATISSNRASAITSAATLAEASGPSSTELTKTLPISTMDTVGNTVEISDVMEAFSEQKEAPEVDDNIIRSSLSIEEQLEKSSNNNIRSENMKKEKLVDFDVQNSTAQTLQVKEAAQANKLERQDISAAPNKATSISSIAIPSEGRQVKTEELTVLDAPTKKEANGVSLVPSTATSSAHIIKENKNAEKL